MFRQRFSTLAHSVGGHTRPMPRTVTADEAVAIVKSGDRVFLHGVAATPHHLLSALVRRAPQLRDVELCGLHLEPPSDFLRPELRDSFKLKAFFTGHAAREAMRDGRASFYPLFLSEVPKALRTTLVPDVAFVHVSPPDRNGWCSLGTSVDVAVAAVESAKMVVAQVNPNMPRMLGAGLVHVSNFDRVVEMNTPLPTGAVAIPDANDLAIGRHVASLIEDGSCLQAGIGAIPNAVMSFLTDRKELGIHSEMISDGSLALLRSGAVTNEHKHNYRNFTAVGFVYGSKDLYDFVHDNPGVQGMPIDVVNNPYFIAQNDKVCAINSCIEIDLTGQVCSDSIGHDIFSGIGGQMDFIRGASMSKGGKPIIALPSRTSKGISRIVPELKPGAGVVTTRGHVHWIATEHGLVNLWGRTIEDRARLLISIAHPEDRENLKAAWFKNHKQKL